MVLKQAIFCVAALTLSAGLLYISSYSGLYPEAMILGQGVSSFEDLSDKFEELARSKGAVYAFKVLKVASLPPNTDLHLLGHRVGEILYEQKGVGGIAGCTQDFRNACSHTIVIGALNEYGSAGAGPLIKDACTKAPGGPGAYTMCFHGLGHGVFAYFAYSLPETISFCRKFGTSEYNNQEYTECVGGAIMELVGGGGHDHEQWLLARKKYLITNPLSPCMDGVIPHDAKEICLTYLTPRLFELTGADIGNPSPETFPTAFRFCEAISPREDKLRKQCFGGFGKEFIPLVGSRDIRDISKYSDEQFIQAVEWCLLAPHKEAQEACIGDALESVFWGGENDPDTAFRFCDLVSDDGATVACFKRLSDAIVRYIESPLREHLCGRLPSQLRESCYE